MRSSSVVIMTKHPAARLQHRRPGTPTGSDPRRQVNSPMGGTLHCEQCSCPRNLQVAAQRWNGHGQSMEHRTPSSLLSVEEKKRDMYSTHQLLIKFKVFNYSYLFFPDPSSTLGGCVSVSPTRLLHSGAGLGQSDSSKFAQRRHPQRN